MKLELKKLQYSEFASHETHCFEADIWVEGKKALFAENEGRGGPNNYSHPVLKGESYPHCGELGVTEQGSIQKIINSIVAEKKGDLKSQYGHWVDECDNRTLMDTIISLMIERKLQEKDLKKDLRKYILFTNEAGKLMQAKPRSRKVGPEEIDLFLTMMAENEERYITILNDMPFEEAYEIVFPTVRVGSEIDA